VTQSTRPVPVPTSQDRLTRSSGAREGLARKPGGEPLKQTARPLHGWRLAGWAWPLAALGLLEILVRTGVVPGHILPAPSDIALALWQQGPRALFDNVAASCARVAAGFAIGAALAVVVGALVGFSRRVELLLEPAFQALRAIPSLAWVPLLLLWMGIDEAPKVTLIAIGAFFPVYLGVVAGLHGVDRKLVELGTIYRLGPVQMATRILLPAALPQIFTGLRNGLSLAWMFVVAAELIAATNGVGFLLSDGRETGRPEEVFGAILLLAVLGKVSDGLLKFAETRALHWRDVARQTR
jgi:sulfonate transport system permease protein